MELFADVQYIGPDPWSSRLEQWHTLRWVLSCQCQPGLQMKDLTVNAAVCFDELLSSVCTSRVEWLLSRRVSNPSHCRSSIISTLPRQRPHQNPHARGNPRPTSGDPEALLHALGDPSCELPQSPETMNAHVSPSVVIQILESSTRDHQPLLHTYRSRSHSTETTSPLRKGPSVPPLLPPRREARPSR